MKVVLGKSSNEARVYTDDGKDITADLHIAQMDISVMPGELVKLTMVCHPASVKIDGCEINKSFTDYVKLEPPSYAGNSFKNCGVAAPSNPCSEIMLEIPSKSPEAVLDQFKVQPIKPESE